MQTLRTYHLTHLFGFPGARLRLLLVCLIKLMLNFLSLTLSGLLPRPLDKTSVLALGDTRDCAAILCLVGEGALAKEETGAGVGTAGPRVVRVCVMDAEASAVGSKYKVVS